MLEFIQKYEISLSLLREVISSPSKIDHNLEPCTLYYKRFENERKSHLLVGVHEDQPMFAYWIPSDLVCVDWPLLEVLRLFIHRFGKPLRIGDSEGLLIRNVQYSTEGHIKFPIHTSAKDEYDVPQEIHHPLRLAGQNGNIFKYHIAFAFIIETYPYLNWLFPVKKISKRIPKHLLTRFGKVLERLNPDGTSKIIMIKNPIGSVSEPRAPFEYQNIEIPEPYKKPIDYLFQIVDQLENEGDNIQIAIRNGEKICLFCGSQKLSKEHIFPKWHRKYFPKKQIDLHQLFFNTKETSQPLDLSQFESKSEDSYGITDDRICIECNGGWLSKLEETCMYIIIGSNRKLFSTVVELNLDEPNRLSLSRWMSIKAILLTTRKYISFPDYPEFLKSLMEGYIPNGFVVEIAEVNDSQVSYSVQMGCEIWRRRITDRSVENAASDAKLLFCGVIQFGHFLFRVSYLPPTNGLVRLNTISSFSILYNSSNRFVQRHMAEVFEVWNHLSSDARVTYALRSILLVGESDLSGEMG